MRGTNLILRMEEAWVCQLMSSLKPYVIRLPSYQSLLFRSLSRLTSAAQQTWKGLIDGKDQIPVGVAEKTFQGFEMKRQEMFGDMLKRIQASTSN